MDLSTLPISTELDNDCEIISRTLNDNNELEIVIKRKSNAMYACNPPRPVPDHVSKEIYHVEDGKITLKDIIIGTHTPMHTVREQITFDES